jgi:hypothetical protein
LGAFQDFAFEGGDSWLHSLREFGQHLVIGLDGPQICFASGTPVYMLVKLSGFFSR